MQSPLFLQEQTNLLLGRSCLLFLAIWQPLYCAAQLLQPTVSKASVAHAVQWLIGSMPGLSMNSAKTSAFA